MSHHFAKLKHFSGYAQISWLMVGLIVTFVAPALLPSRVFIPTDIIVKTYSPWMAEPNQGIAHNFLLGDVVNYIYPVKLFMAEAIRRGELPLWNPYTFTGYPFIYNTQAGFFYPFSLFYYWFDGPTAVDATVIGQLVVGAWFMLAYLRRLGLHPWATAVGAVLFLFNGSVIVWLEWQVIYAAFIWLPAQLYLIERLHEWFLDHQQTTYLAVLRQPYPYLLAIVFAIPWLGGHWNWTLYTSITVALYMLFRLPRWTNLWLTATSLGLGTTIALVQVLPALHYLSQSHRQPLSLSQSLAFGLKRFAVAWFVPNFYGNSLADNWWGGAMTNDFEIGLYLGLLMPFLLVTAVVWRRDWHTRFFALWGGLTLLWALGTPAYTVLHLLPVFNGLYPSRFAFIAIFCATMLAVLGLDALLTAAKPMPKMSTWWGLTAVQILLIVGGYTFFFRHQVGHYWAFLQWEFTKFGLSLAISGAILGLYQTPIGRSWVWGGVVLLWVTADLWSFGWGHSHIGHIDELYPPNTTVAYLQADLEQEVSRIATIRGGFSFFNNSALAVQIPNVTGYDPGVLLRLHHYFAIEAYLENPEARFGRLLYPKQPLADPLMQALNIKHVVTNQTEEPLALVDGLQLVHESANARIYLNEGYFPRAYAVPSAQIVANETEALLVLQARPHTLNQVVILELEGQPPPPTTSGQGLAGGEVQIEAYGLNEVRLTAVMPAAGFVVLSDTYYPGWQATLNGQPTPIYRANSIVRAVFVPAGEHELIFTFWPSDFVIGAIAATIGLGVALLGLLVASYTYLRHSTRL